MKQSQMLKGILEGCVLKVLDESPGYSGSIVEKLREHGFQDMAEGTLFPLLLRLENQGLFDVKRVSNPLGPSRKYYSLNDEGKKELQQFIETWTVFKMRIDSILEENNCEDITNKSDLPGES